MMSASLVGGLPAATAAASPTARLAEHINVRVRVLAFFASVLVVIRHAPTVDVQRVVTYPAPTIPWGMPGDFDLFLTTLVQQFVSGQLAALGTAIFLFTSGYLFFRTTLEGTIRDWYVTKVRKRVRTILIPFLIWSAFSFAMVALVQSIIGDRLFRGMLIIDFAASDYARRLLLHPYAYPLWYLRDLMILALVSPAIYLAIRKIPVLFLSALLVAWLAFPESPVRLDGPLFFCLGAAVALKGWGVPNELPAGRAAFAIGIWLTMCAAATALSFWSPTTALLLTKAATIVGGAVVWMCYRQLFGHAERYIFPIAFSSFFLFVAHEPMLRGILRASLWLFGQSPLALSAVYVIAPTIVITMVCATAVFVRKRSPGLYALLTARP